MKEIKIDVLENIVGGNCFIVGATAPLWIGSMNYNTKWFWKNVYEAHYCWNS